MQISEILKKINSKYKIYNFFETDIKGITAHSDEVKKNFIFGAVKGSKTNGEKYINSLLKYQPLVFIVSSESKLNFKTNKNQKIIIIRTNYVKKLLYELASIFYSDSSIEKIAVTGTNGKTSIVDYSRQILSMLNVQAASIGTLGLIFRNKLLHSSNLTTPDSIYLHQKINSLSKQNCKKIILEASSIGLDQNRLYPLKFDAVAFSNLSRDHLDYHKSMNNYLKSKLLLFKEHLKKNSIAVIFSDSKYSDHFVKVCIQKKILILDFGKKANFLKINYIKKKNEIYEVSCNLRKKKFVFQIISTSEYEIYNKICALILVFGKKIKSQNFVFLNKLKNPPGRLEKIFEKNDIKVFVDYAHTPNAIKNVLKALKKITKGNLFLIFGCGGDRDKGKRLLMTKEALKFADNIIITDDNPRNENPKKIRDEMIIGIKKTHLNKIQQIPNRKKAIEYGVKKTEYNDILLIAGKGHENYQIIGNKKKFFSDKKVALEFLKKK